MTHPKGFQSKKCSVRLEPMSPVYSSHIKLSDNWDDNLEIDIQAPPNQISTPYMSINWKPKGKIFKKK